MSRLILNKKYGNIARTIIKKTNTGGKRLVVAPRPPTISNITSGSSGGGIGGGGI